MNAYVKTFSILATFSIAMVIASDAHAQCSGSRSGRGGGQPPPTTGSTSQFTSLTNQSNLLAYQRQIAYLQQLALQQQQTGEATSRLSSQQQAIQDRRQEVYATRLAWAEAKRTRRTARKAARLGESSGSFVTAAKSRSTLVSLQDANPFQ